MGVAILELPEIAEASLVEPRMRWCKLYLNFGREKEFLHYPLFENVNVGMEMCPDIHLYLPPSMIP